MEPRLVFTRDRIDSAAAWNYQYGERTARWPAQTAIVFKGQIRHAANSTVTPYASATAQYVSRIGYQVIGYI